MRDLNKTRLLKAVRGTMEVAKQHQRVVLGYENPKVWPQSKNMKGAWTECEIVGHVLSLGPELRKFLKDGNLVEAILLLGFAQGMLTSLNVASINEFDEINNQ